MIVDAYLHCTGHETTDDVLRALDDAGVEVDVLLAPFLSEGCSLDDAESLHRGNAHLAKLTGIATGSSASRSSTLRTPARRATRRPRSTRWASTG